MRPNLDHILHVTRNMRQADREEIFALQYSDDEEVLARLVHAACGPFAWVFAADDGEPVAIMGVKPMHPNVFDAFMYATPRFGEVGAAMTRFVRKAMIPLLLKSKIHRVHAISKADHFDAHRWLEMLGARREATLEQYGKGGEDYVVFTWTRRDIENRRAATRH